jgi:hypothetical protein
MSNSFAVTSKITFEALEVLENMLSFSKHVNREYDDQFAREGGKIGSTVNVRKPPRYQVGIGPVIDPQAIVDTYVPVTITTQAHVPVSITSAQMAMSLEDRQQQIYGPAMATIANKIDLDGCTMAALTTHNCVGTPGLLTGGSATSAQAMQAILQSSQRLDEEAAPDDEQRYAVIGPATNTGLVQAHSSLFNAQPQISRQYQKGHMGDDVLGFNFYRSQNIVNFTSSSLASAKTNTVNGAQGSTNTVQSDATTPYTLTVNNIGADIPAGTSVTFAGAYAVNPQSRVTTGSLKNFVVAENYTSGGTSLKILPYPIFSGPFQNVTASGNAFPNNSTLSLLNGYSSALVQQNLLFHRNAYTLVCVDLPSPKGNGQVAFAQSKAAGLSIRYVRDWYDARTDQVVSRFDVLYGWKAIYPELAVKLNG